MPETVFVSHIDTTEVLERSVSELFAKAKYDELSRAIGMHSILIDPEHTTMDQGRLYRMVLDLFKERTKNTMGHQAFSSWLKAFPRLLGDLITSGQIVTDRIAVDVIASQVSAFGPFRSVDDFFHWALDDRRLTLGQIIAYLERTITSHRS